MNLMSVPGMFVCSNFLISVCMFSVSKSLLISSATVIVRAGGAIWLNTLNNTVEKGFNQCVVCVVPSRNVVLVIRHRSD